MARRSKSQEGLFAVLLLIGGAIAVVKWTADSGVLVPIVVTVVVISVVIVAVSYTQKRAARQSLLTETEATVGRHLQALLRRRVQLLRYDTYGKVQIQDWGKEIQYFIDSQLLPVLNDPQRRILTSERDKVTLLIAQRIEEAAATTPAFAEIPAKMTGHEFEAYCAEELRRTGWQAYVKSGSRDQGIDVVANKDGVRLVLQCKLYSQPVGNKAVQEAYAGKAFEGAQYTAVVTNNVYTPSAQQLAATNGVLLLHYSELAGIDVRLKGPAGPPRTDTKPADRLKPKLIWKFPPDATKQKNKVRMFAECECGSTVPYDDTWDDNARVTCPNCDADHGTYGNYKKQAREAVDDFTKGNFKKYEIKASPN